MRKYNARATCPKCGGTFVSTRHRNVFGHEAIGRSCHRCGYGWFERPLDASDDVDEVAVALQRIGREPE